MVWIVSSQTPVKEDIEGVRRLLTFFFDTPIAANILHLTHADLVGPLHDDLEAAANPTIDHEHLLKVQPKLEAFLEFSGKKAIAELLGRRSRPVAAISASGYFQLSNHGMVNHIAAGALDLLYHVARIEYRLSGDPVVVEAPDATKGTWFQRLFGGNSHPRFADDDSWYAEGEAMED